MRWSGVYKTVETVWLRWATSEGEILPTVDELSAQKAQEAQRQAQEAQQRSQELEILLNRYRQQFGELPESGSDHF